jgi:hypothetical protein
MAQHEGMVSMRDLVGNVPREAWPDVVSFLEEVGPAARLDGVEGLLRQLADGLPIAAAEGQRVKRFLQSQGNQFFRAAERGALPQAGARSELAGRMSRGARGRIEGIVGDQRLPGGESLPDINARTQDLIGLERLGRRAENLNHIVTRGAAAVPLTALTGNPVAGVLAALAASPGGMSSYAVMLKKLAGNPTFANNPTLQALLAQELLRTLPRDGNEEPEE